VASIVTARCSALAMLAVTRIRSDTMSAVDFSNPGSDLFGESGVNANVWVASSDGDLERVRALIEVLLMILSVHNFLQPQQPT
jgi:hypothetical protein